MIQAIQPSVLSPPQPIIQVENLCKSFAGQPLYADFNLNLPKGEFVSIFGPNGCGKSTLINMMSGLLPIDSGRILIGGKPISKSRIGYVFQNYRDALFPWQTALDNIIYPLRVRGIPEQDCRQQAEQLIQSFDITLDLNQYPYTFSGGQQQLISILRALIADPEVLFLDEPFSALDFETTLYVREKLQKIFLESGLTMVMVVHNLEEAVYLADRILLLSKRPTRVVEAVRFAAPRPRTFDTLTTPEFIQVSSHCLDIFRQEMRL